jgi:hypothetical protein
MTKRIAMTREDLEGLLGEKIFDWQWEWVVEVLIKKQTPTLRRKDPSAFRPATIETLAEEIRRRGNEEAYKKEVLASNSILRRNRYSTKPPYLWYGPDPEPTPSTINEHRRLMGLPPADERKK